MKLGLGFPHDHLTPENLPGDHWDHLLYGRTGREEQMERVGRTIQNMGKAGIPVLGYIFCIHNVAAHWRAYDQGGGRANSAIKSFDLNRLKHPPHLQNPHGFRYE